MLSWLNETSWIRLRLVYGFTLNKEDNWLICGEGHVDGEAVSIHIGSAIKVLGPAMVGWLIKMESVVMV